MKSSVIAQIFLGLSPTLIDIIVVLLSIVFIIGFIMNLLVIIIYAITPRTKSINNYFHMNIIIANLLCICYNIPVQISYYLSYKYNYYVFMNVIVCKLFLALTIIHDTVVGYTIIAISYYRYVAIKYGSRNKFTKKNTFVLITFIWVFAIALAVPELIFTKVVVASSNVTLCAHVFPSDTSRIISYISVNMLNFVLPLIWIVFANLFMGYQVQKKFDGVRKMKGGLVSSISKSSSFNVGRTSIKVFTSVQSRLLKLTTAFVIAYIVCFIPTRIYDIVIAFLSLNSAATVRPLSAVYVVCTFFYYANAAINPIMYVSINDRFLAKLCQLINYS